MKNIKQTENKISDQPKIPLAQQNSQQKNKIGPQQTGISMIQNSKTHTLQSKRKVNSSFVKQFKTCFFLPIYLLIGYFTVEMIFLSSINLGSEIHLAFKRFFLNIKQILEQNTIFLLFWSIIIIKAKIPQLQRLFYHTIIISILCDEQETQCSICLQDQCDYVIPKCQHPYHAQCLEKWIKSQGCCPYCRMKVEYKLIRKVPWKKVLKAISENKIKWILILVVCVSIQYRIYFNFFKIL